jgi:hypothetical protein
MDAGKQSKYYRTYPGDFLLESANRLQHLEFDITDDDQFLQINGQPVFPPPKTLIPISLTATQIRTTDSSHSAPLRLGYAFEVLPTKSEVTDVTLTPIQFTILDLEGVPVKVDTVKLDLIQSWGHRHIARVSTIPYAQSPGADQCTTSICRLRAIIANRLRKMIESAKSGAGKATTWIKNGCPGRKRPHAGAEYVHEKAHPHHDAHHRLGRLRHFFTKMIHIFVVPALLGFWGGLVICSLGLLVGHALVRRFKRRSNRDSPRNVEDALEDDEKDALVENGELPPQYEDVEVIVVEEK